jgi:outer membrane protein OmpA-like peptidoglycan-associated protein
MVARVVLVIVASAGVAMADPPSGYRCGAGKAVAGKGCACPSGSVEKRDGENNATCVAAVGPTCSDAARGLVSATSIQNRDAAVRWIAALCSSWSRAAVRCYANDPAPECEDKLNMHQLDDLTVAILDADEAPHWGVAYAQEREIWFKPSVVFAPDLATFAKDGAGGLEAVTKILQAHQALRKVEIQVNADDAKLGQDRAAAIRDYLVAKGVAGDRLVPKSTDVVSDRRTRFVILERAAGPPPARRPVIELAKRMVGKWSCKVTFAGDGYDADVTVAQSSDWRLSVEGKPVRGDRTHRGRLLSGDISIDTPGVLNRDLAIHGVPTAITYGEVHGDEAVYHGIAAPKANESSANTLRVPIKTHDEFTANTWNSTTSSSSDGKWSLAYTFTCSRSR